jgi:hypothetical protein
MRHSHSLRRTTLLVVSVTLAALVVGIPTAAPADLQDVTLTCSDGTNLNLALDAASVLQLTDAVNAIALNPAGDPPLTCGVVTASLLQSTADGSRQLAAWGPHRSIPGIRKGLTRTFGKTLHNATRTLSSGNPTYDYVVGGGQAPNLGCFGGFPPVPFGLSAHVRPGDLPETASGTFNVGSPATNFGCKGHLNSTVDCLVVSGTTGGAHLTAHVTQATGQFAGLQDTEIDVAVQDNGTPSPLLPDMIDDGNTSGPCVQGRDAQGEFTVADQPVTNGNISVHFAG